MRFRQHAAGEFHAVIGQPRYVAESVEGAIHGSRKRKADFGQAPHQEFAVERIARLDRVQLCRCRECLGSGDLRQFRRGYIEALLDALDRPHQSLGQHHPADPPAGHAVIFRK